MFDISSLRVSSLLSLSLIVPYNVMEFLVLLMKFEVVPILFTTELLPSILLANPRGRFYIFTKSLRC